MRRNTKEFALVAGLLEEYRNSPQRRKLINLYALKPGEKLPEKILINKLKQNATVLYNMSYESILQHLNDKSQKLYRESGQPLYYFKSSAGSNWLKFPFEFRGKLQKQVFPLRVVK